MDDFSNDTNLQHMPYENSNQTQVDYAIDWVKEDIGKVSYHAAQSMAVATALQTVMGHGQMSQAIMEPINRGIGYAFSGRAVFVQSIAKITAGIAISSYVVNSVMDSYVDNIIAPAMGDTDMTDRHDMSVIVGSALSFAVSYGVSTGMACASRLIERYRS